MSRELTSSLLASVAATVTSPGYLVRIELATQTLRLSSRGDVTWRGELYVARGFRVDELGEDGESGTVTARIVINDADRAYTALLIRGVADRPICIWKFYGDAPGYHDVIPRATGVGEVVDFNINEATVSVTMTGAGSATQFSPRRYITRQEGFSITPPAGTVINWAGESFALVSE